MTKIIGILNLTLDSFSDGGKYYDRDSAKKHISVMIEEGADVIDLGAESTRSGFTDVDEDIQISTLAPIIDYINSHFEIEISIDTRSSKVANAFKSSNIKYINDVSSGLHDRAMMDVVASLGCKFIITHMPPEHKEGKVKEFKNILDDIKKYFAERIDACIKSGIDKENIIIDPGIGFGKSGEDNVLLLNNIELFRAFTSMSVLGQAINAFHLNCLKMCLQKMI